MAAYDRGPECAAVIGLFLGLTWIFFSLRMYVKIFLSKSWGVDDLFLVIAIALFTTYSITGALGVKYGTGKHTTEIKIYNIPKALHYWFLCEIFYTLTTAFIRLSIAIFLIRITLKRFIRIIIYITMIAITCFSIFYFFLILFQCSPVSYFWNQYKGEHGHCMNPKVVPDASIAHSAVSFTADWTLGLLPITYIWSLKINRRTKISLACILALGLLAGIAAIIRIPYIKVLTITDDFLYATTDVAIWSTVEAGLGIIAASAYTLRPLFRRILASRSSADASGDGKLSGTTSGPMRRRTTSRSIPHHQEQQLQRDLSIVHATPMPEENRQSWLTPPETPEGEVGGDSPTIRGMERRTADRGGVQVHRSVAVGEEDSGEDLGEDLPMPWREGMGSNTSTV